MKYTIHYTNGKTYTIKCEYHQMLRWTIEKDVDFVSYIFYTMDDSTGLYFKCISIYSRWSLNNKSIILRSYIKKPAHLKQYNPASKTKRQIREEQDKQNLIHKVTFNTTPSPEDMVCTNKDYSFWLGNVEDRSDD